MHIVSIKATRRDIKNDLFSFLQEQASFEFDISHIFSALFPKIPPFFSRLYQKKTYFCNRIQYNSITHE